MGTRVKKIRRMEKRKYQEQVISETTKYARDRKNVEVGVFMAPNLGKSYVMMRVIKNLPKKAKHIILAHNQYDYVDNLLPRFEKMFPDKKVTSNISEIETADLFISIPAALINVSPEVLSRFDYEWRDEAHQIAEAKTLGLALSKKINAKKKFLLSGTPANHVNKDIAKIFVAKLDVPAKYNYQKIDYFIQNIKNIDPLESEYVEAGFIDSIWNRIDILGNLNSFAIRCGFKSFKNYAKKRKIIIKVTENKHAEKVFRILEEAGITKLAVSTSKSDKNREQVARFKNEQDKQGNHTYSPKEELRCVVVCNRMVQGYDDCDLDSFLNMTGSRSVAVTNQEEERLSRVNINKTNTKHYVKFAPNNQQEYFKYKVILPALCLFHSEFFTTFDGHDHNVFKFPISQDEFKNDIEHLRQRTLAIKEDRVDAKGEFIYTDHSLTEDIPTSQEIYEERLEANHEAVRSANKPDSEKKKRKTVNKQPVDKYVTLQTKVFLDELINFDEDDYGSYVSYSTVSASLASKDFIFYSLEEHVNLGIKFSVTSTREWNKVCKKAKNKKGYAYYSTPWYAFNMSSVEFLELINGTREAYHTLAEHVDYGIENNIPTGSYWRANCSSFVAKKGFKLSEVPWRYFGITAKEFTTLLAGKNSPLKECVREAKKAKLYSTSLWTKQYKTLIPKKGYRFPSCPWITYGITHTAFTEMVSGKYHSLKYSIKEGKLRGISGTKTWAKKHKTFKPKEGYKFHSQPWDLYDIPSKEFTKMLNS